jgi:acyl-CoA synthetase (AMP-forming)/AMP-acid ligase II
MSETEKRPSTIGELARFAAELHKERCAIEDGARRTSFAALDAARRSAAAAFIAAGIERGDRVAIWAPNREEWIVAALGLQSIGAVLVPINTRFKGAEVAYVLNRSRARMLVMQAQLLGTDYLRLLEEQALPSLERVIVLEGESSSTSVASMSWPAFLQAGERVSSDVVDERCNAVGPADVSDILFTSGTTGNPRGVRTTHGQNLRTFESWATHVGLRSSDRYLIVNPFFHAFGYKAGWLAALLRGATILPHAVFDADAILERIASDRVTVLPGPPSLYQSLLERVHESRHALGSLRLAVTGAASIPVSLIQRMRSELGFETVITGYGLTESCGVVTMCSRDDDAETIATTCGRALEGLEVRCVGADGSTVTAGEPGEVLVRGYNVMRDYLDEPQATAEAIDSEGWLHTGDIGVLDARGYLRITDRKKDMFIVGGFNCYPAEIENLMLMNPHYARVAVVGIPDARMGEVGMAFVVPSPDAQLSEASVIAWCRAHMANYKVPRRVALVDALPLTASGKVQKLELRRRAAET